MANVEKKNEITRSQAMAFAIENLEGVASSEMIEVLTKIKASIERKSTSKKDEERKETDNRIVNALLVEMVKGKGYTVTDMVNALPSLAGLSTSKVTALLKKPLADGYVEKKTEKGRSVYYLA